MAKAERPGSEPPRTVELPALAPFAGPALEAGGDYEAVDFADRDLAGQRAEGVAFLGCRFQRSRLDELELPRARFSECLLAEVHATSIDVRDSVWRDCLLADGRIGALAAPGASWTSVRIRGGKLNFVDLSGSRLRHVVFEGCSIGELDLGEAQVRSVRFVGCHLDVLIVEGARLTEVDLSGADLRGLRGIGNLRGATVSREQLIDLAPLLAAHVGLSVLED